MTVALQSGGESPQKSSSLVVSSVYNQERNQTPVLSSGESKP